MDDFGIKYPTKVDITQTKKPSIVTLLFFYRDGFGIKYPTKVDIP